MKKFVSVFLILFLFGNIHGFTTFDESELTSMCPPCNNGRQGSSSEHADAIIRKLLTMCEGMTKDIQYLRESVSSLTDKYKRYNESREAALDKEIKRLRDETHACKSKNRDGRAESNTECTSKIVEVAVEAKREIAKIQENSDVCFKELAKLKTNAMNETQVLSLKTENKELTEKLEEIQKRYESECLENSNATDHFSLERGGRSTGQIQWSRPKPSEGKTGSVSKIPSNTYQHSCKGFMDSKPSTVPSPTEISVRIGNRQYLIGEQEMTWAQAWRLCRARGMWILSLESDHEQLELEPHLNHIFKTPIKYWLFARKPVGSEWYNWECSTSNDSIPWKLQHNAEANNKSPVRCATLDLYAKYDIVYGDDTCDSLHRYICRKLVPDC